MSVGSSVVKRTQTWTQQSGLFRQGDGGASPPRQPGLLVLLVHPLMGSYKCTPVHAAMSFQVTVVLWGLRCSREQLELRCWFLLWGGLAFHLPQPFESHKFHLLTRIVLSDPQFSHQQLCVVSDDIHCVGSICPETRRCCGFWGSGCPGLYGVLWDGKGQEMRERAAGSVDLLHPLVAWGDSLREPLRRAKWLLEGASRKRAMMVFFSFPTQLHLKIDF